MPSPPSQYQAGMAINKDGIICFAGVFSETWSKLRGRPLSIFAHLGNNRFMDNAESKNEVGASVAQRVLMQFVEAVAEVPNLQEVAHRLKTAIVNQRLGEAALKAALFGDTDV